MTTTAKRYHFFDPPIDFLAPSRTRSAYVTEADYLVLEQERDQLKAKVALLEGDGNRCRVCNGTGGHEEGCRGEAVMQLEIDQLQQAAQEAAKMLTLALDNIQGIADGNDIPSTAIRDAGAKALTALRQAGVMP